MGARESLILVWSRDGTMYARSLCTTPEGFVPVINSIPGLVRRARSAGCACLLLDLTAVDTSETGLLASLVLASVRARRGAIRLRVLASPPLEAAASVARVRHLLPMERAGTGEPAITLVGAAPGHRDPGPDTRREADAARKTPRSAGGRDGHRAVSR